MLRSGYIKTAKTEGVAGAAVIAVPIALRNSIAKGVSAKVDMGTLPLNLRYQEFTKTLHYSYLVLVEAIPLFMQYCCCDNVNELILGGEL